MQPTHSCTPLSARLRAETRDAHAALDGRMMASEPFRDLGRYARFLVPQHALFSAVERFYAGDAAAGRPPDVPLVSRLSAVERDFADLGLAPPSRTTPPEATPAGALGWLYVSEGSRLGGAHLAKEAARLGLGDGFGARHLAPPEGLGRSWNAFRKALDEVELDDVGCGQAVEAALAAFAFVDRAAEAAFAAEPAVSRA